MICSTDLAGRVTPTGRVRRPFRHACRIQKLANSTTVHYSLLPVPCSDDTATVYYNYRHYEPVAGRWMTRDPIEEWGGLNMLAFVCNCSVSTVDIAGMSIGDYIPIWSTFMSAIDLVIGHIPGQSSVDYPFVSPSECKCNEEAAEASCIKAVEIKAIEYISEALKQLVTGVIVDAIVSVVGIKANFIVGGILAANALVDMGLKSTIYSKVMSGSNEAMKHNCDCGQYTK